MIDAIAVTATVGAALCAVSAFLSHHKVKKLVGEVQEAKASANRDALAALTHSKSAESFEQQARDSREATSRSALNALQHSKTAWEHAESARSAFVVVSSVSAPSRSTPGKDRAGLREEIAARASSPDVVAQHKEIAEQRHANSGLIAPDATAQSDPAAFRAKFKAPTPVAEPAATTPPAPQETAKDAKSIRSVARQILKTPNVNW